MLLSLNLQFSFISTNTNLLTEFSIWLNDKMTNWSLIVSYSFEWKKLAQNEDEVHPTTVLLKF